MKILVLATALIAAAAVVVPAEAASMKKKKRSVMYKRRLAIRTGIGCRRRDSIPTAYMALTASYSAWTRIRTST